MQLVTILIMRLIAALFYQTLVLGTELLDFGLPIIKLNIDGLGRTWVTLWTGVG